MIIMKFLMIRYVTILLVSESMSRSGMIFLVFLRRGEVNIAPNNTPPTVAANNLPVITKTGSIFQNIYLNK